MKILLAQVPTSHLGAGERVYPLGLSRLSGLVPSQFRKFGLDMNLHPDPWPLLKEMLLETRPDVVALSFRNMDPLAGRCASYLSSLETAAALTRRLAPNARIFAGGPAFSLFGRRLMRAVPELDGGLIGEGETAFPKLVSDPENPSAVPGLVWRNGRGLTQNPTAAKITLGALPGVDADVFNPADYIEQNAYVAAIGIEGKRGCDLRCSYCVYPRLGGNRMRLRPPVEIVDEMERLHEECGATLFHFTDSVVNRPSEHFEAVCREIVARRLKLKWTGFFREDNVTREQLDLAMRAGLVAVYFSGDALTDHGLKLLNKRLTRRHLFSAARVTADLGILTMHHFLANLPGETDDLAARARETLDRILAIHEPVGNLGAVIFNTVRLYPGASLTRWLLKKGLLDPGVDLLYPIHHNPRETARHLHELEAHCHAAGVFSRLEIGPRPEVPQ